MKMTPKLLRKYQDGMQDGIQKALNFASLPTPPKRDKPPLSNTNEGDVEVFIKLVPPNRNVHIPVGRDTTIVGREEIIDQVAKDLLEGSCSRILLHGPPGVGKDTVAAMVVKRPDVRMDGEGLRGASEEHRSTGHDAPARLQAWLQASSESVLQRQLVELFTTHRPEVLHDVVREEIKNCIEKIKEWLSTTEEKWLFVFEDAHEDSATVWDILKGHRRGRVLITTSQESVKGDPTLKRIPLCTLKREDSIGLLLKIGGNQDWCPKDLERDDITNLLDEKLGNLPLSVAMMGSLMSQMRQDGKKNGSTKDMIISQMIQEFKRNTATLDVMYRSKKDKHYFGLTRSVLLAVNRLQGDEAEIAGAKGLLVAMSMLHRSETPLALLLDDGNEAQVCSLPFDSSRILHCIVQPA
jgi:DNA polymerase III delta prime subunit